MHRTFLAMTVAVGVLAASTIGAAPSQAASCSDTGYVVAQLKAAMMMPGPPLGIWAKHAPAMELAAWRRLRRAPLPCDSNLLLSRTHELRWHFDEWLAAKAIARGDVKAALTGTAGHEEYLANRAFARWTRR